MKSGVLRPGGPIAPFGNEKIRFLLVGIWNTLIGYAVFVAVHAAASDWLSPIVTLITSYVIALPHSFITQRLFVFRSFGRWPSQFTRFLISNSLVFFSNIIFLPVAIAATAASPVVVQAVFVALSTMATYVLHKHFSFTR